MNAKHALLILAAMAALNVRADERVSASDLPPAAQKTLESSRAQGPVKEIIRRTTANGRTVYDVEIEKNNAPNPRLRIAEDGTLVRDIAPVVNATGDGVPLVTDEFGGVVSPFPKLKLSELPAPVQQTVRQEANGREVADIDHENWKGRSVYEVEFAQRGVNSRIYVGDDGTLVRDERPRHSLKSIFMGTQLEDTPTAVQQTIRRIAGDREIADIDKKGTTTEPIYRVELNDSQGTQELRVTQDGKVIYDSRSPKPPRG